MCASHTMILYMRPLPKWVAFHVWTSNGTFLKLMHNDTQVMRLAGNQKETFIIPLCSCCKLILALHGMLHARGKMHHFSTRLLWRDYKEWQRMPTLDKNRVGDKGRRSLSLSCPSARRWRCSTRFLVSTHVAPQFKDWGANTAAYCTSESLPRCRWMWLVALLVSARTLCYCHINLLLFKGCQPPVANCTPFFSIPGQFLKSVKRDPAFT